jgi:hypothetical protein
MPNISTGNDCVNKLQALTNKLKKMGRMILWKRGLKNWHFRHSTQTITYITICTTDKQIVFDLKEAEKWQ